jgi:hypothetical protein
MREENRTLKDEGSDSRPGWSPAPIERWGRREPQEMWFGESRVSIGLSGGAGLESCQASLSLAKN